MRKRCSGLSNVRRYSSTLATIFSPRFLEWQRTGRRRFSLELMGTVMKPVSKNPVPMAIVPGGIMLSEGMLKLGGNVSFVCWNL